MSKCQGDGSNNVDFVNPLDNHSLPQSILIRIEGSLIKKYPLHQIQLAGMLLKKAFYRGDCHNRRMVDWIAVDAR